MHAPHHSLRPPRRNAGRESQTFGDGRAPPRHDDDVRTTERAPILAPGPRWKRPCDRARRRTFGAHHRDVDVAGDIEPLIRVVQNQHLGSRPPGALRAGHTVGVRDNDGPGNQPLMHGLLVAAVAAQQDARLQAPPREERGGPRRDRRLSSAPDRQVPDRNRRQRQWAPPQPTPLVGGCASRHEGAVDHREGQQHATRDTRGCGATPPEPLREPMSAHDAVITS